MGARCSWRQQIKIHPVSTVLIALLTVVIVLIILSILGYIFNWHWTGLVSETSEPKQHAKTLWDWLQLLIIPAVLAVAGYVINLTISRGEQAATEQRAQSEREATQKRATTEREIAQDNQREAALQEYIDKMSELLLHGKLRESQLEDEVRTIARVLTLSILSRLDAKRKGNVLQFLHESELIKDDTRIINLLGADLQKADLSGADLSGADLSKASLIKANLSGANLGGANLSGANLSKANLGEILSSYLDVDDGEIFTTRYTHTNLSGANLSGAHLYKAYLEKADMSGADLSGAYLSRADLLRVDLRGAIVTKEQLDGVFLLEDATMPDGSIHP